MFELKTGTDMKMWERKAGHGVREEGTLTIHVDGKDKWVLASKR